ncbi:MAG: nucleotidyltransferase, partial [Candidatus Hydrogenedentes bacterium]|nr:nucleotidyltransferase [Candidatus Hydrogenedentota bacterium]
GRRYGGLKQIDPVGPSGEIIIDYSLYDAVRTGFEKIVFVITRDLEDEFRNIVGERYNSIVDVDYAYQELDAIPSEFEVPPGREKPWGTGHAILVARNAIDGPFAVINADDFYGREAFAAMAAWLKEECRPDLYNMIGYVLRNTLSDHGSVSRGVCQTDDDGYLQGITETTRIEKKDGRVVSVTQEEETDLDGGETVSMNFWGFPPQVFDVLEEQLATFFRNMKDPLKDEFYIPAVIHEALRAGQVRTKVLNSNAHWFGITYRQDMAIAQERIHKLIKAGIYPSPLYD